MIMETTPSGDRPETFRPGSGRGGRKAPAGTPLKGVSGRAASSVAKPKINSEFPATPGRAAAARAAALRRNPDAISRAARSRRCGRCGRAVFEGLDGDRCAVAVRVDPAPLSAAGEVVALMAGRSTYSLMWIAGRSRYEIEPRNQWNIPTHPPGADVNVDVVVEHECGAAELPRGTTTIRRATASSEASGEPTF